MGGATTFRVANFDGRFTQGSSRWPGTTLGWMTESLQDSLRDIGAFQIGDFRFQTGAGISKVSGE
jgi:hypothetical protein